MSLAAYQKRATASMRVFIQRAREALDNIEQGLSPPDEVEPEKLLQDIDELGAEVSQIREWVCRLDGFSDATEYYLADDAELEK